jgi:hypothetical protein
MPILTAAWFIIMQQAQELGDDFTKLAISIGDAPTQARPIDLVIPSSVATDAVITVVMFFALLVWSMILFFIFLGYEVVNVVLSVAGLLLLALYGLGPRTRKTFSIVLALSIVTMLIGRPVGLGIIEIGNMIGASLPGPDNVFFVGAITGVSMMLAIAVQPLLVVGAYRGVSNVMGSINATVRGSVRSVTENKQKLQAQLSGSAPSAMTNRAHRLTETGRAYGRAVGTEAKRAGAASAATALAMTASKAHPVAAVVTTAASIAVKAVGSMPAKSPQSKRSRTDDYR